ncbi:MAG: hypothetical protein WBG86_17890 [Polyangiales bacterium]
MKRRRFFRVMAVVQECEEIDESDAPFGPRIFSSARSSESSFEAGTIHEVNEAVDSLKAAAREFAQAAREERKTDGG